jgi:hypothetical protein
MTLLDKIGRILASGVQILTGFGPLIRMAYPAAAAVEQRIEANIAGFSQIVGMVQGALNAPGQGAARMQVASSLMTQAVLKSDMMTGQHIADEALFKKAIAEYTQATVDLLDSLHHDGADGVGVTK